MPDKQAELFEQRLQEHRASWAYTHVRASDPDTSHLAAVHMERHYSKAEEEAYRALVRWSGSTASEIEQMEGVRDGRVRKRLADLRRKGRAKQTHKRKCKVTGRPAYVWMPK